LIVFYQKQNQYSFFRLNSLKRQLTWLAVWGGTLGMIEAAVVIYLRSIYYPNGFQFPPLPFGDALVKVELAREFASILILWATAELIAQSFHRKFAVFMILFGAWDIFYYVFLKIFLNWPESIFTWDILFLIPKVWAGPVLAPILVSLGLIGAGIVVLVKLKAGYRILTDMKFWLFELVSAGIIVSAFIIPGNEILIGQMPNSFPWFLFIAGLSLGLGSFVQLIRSVDQQND